MTEIGDVLTVACTLPGLGLGVVGRHPMTVEGFEGGRRAALARDAGGLLWRVERSGADLVGELTQQAINELRARSATRGQPREGATC